MRRQHRGDAAHEDRRRAQVVDGQAHVTRGERRRLLDRGVVDPASAPRPIEDPRLAAGARPLRAVERRLDVDALAEVGAVDVQLEAIERGGGLEVDDPRRHPAALDRRLDEAAAAPALGGSRHVDVQHVGHLAPFVRDEAEIGETGLAALGHLGRDRDGHEAVRPGAVGEHDRPPKPPGGAGGVLAVGRLGRDRHAGRDEAGDDCERTRAQEGHGCFLPAKRW